MSFDDEDPFAPLTEAQDKDAPAAEATVKVPKQRASKAAAKLAAVPTPAPADEIDADELAAFRQWQASKSVAPVAVLERPAYDFAARKAELRKQIEEIQDEDPDKAIALREHLRTLPLEEAHARARGDAYNPDAEICAAHWPQGWPHGTDSANCEHGSFTR